MPCSPFPRLKGVYSRGVRDLSDAGVSVRLNRLPLLPDRVQSFVRRLPHTLACRLISDLAGMTFQTAAIDQLFGCRHIQAAAADFLNTRISVGLARVRRSREFKRVAAAWG